MYRIYRPNKKIHRTSPKRINKIINESHGHKGIMRVWKFNIKTGEKQLRLDKHNLIMDATFNYDMQYLRGINVKDSAKIMHLAIGDDDTSPTGIDIVLGNETYRVPLVSQEETDTGELTTEFYINATEFSGTIEELGVFGGIDSEDWNSGVGINTGNLLARVLYSDTKTTNEELLIQRIDTFS